MSMSSRIDSGISRRRACTDLLGMRMSINIILCIWMVINVEHVAQMLDINAIPTSTYFILAMNFECFIALSANDKPQGRGALAASRWRRMLDDS